MGIYSIPVDIYVPNSLSMFFPRGTLATNRLRVREPVRSVGIGRSNNLLLLDGIDDDFLLSVFFGKCCARGTPLVGRDGVSLSLCGVSRLATGISLGYSSTDYVGYAIRMVFPGPAR